MHNLTGTLLMLGGSADASDVHYLSGFWAPDPYLFILDKGQKHLVVSDLEYGRAKRTARGTKVHGFLDLGLKTGKSRSFTGQATAILRTLKVQSITVSARCPAGLVEDLRGNGVRVKISKSPLLPQRDVKRKPEIAALKESQATAVFGMKTAAKLLRESEPNAKGLLMLNGQTLTSERVRLAIEIASIEKECSTPLSTIVAGGEQGVDGHELGSGPLRANELIIIDIFPRHKGHGYWGDITRTFIKGTPTSEQRRLYNSVKQAHAEALAMIRPGVAANEIHEHVIETFKHAGYESGMIDGIPQGFYHSTGHGVGLDIHEYPSISKMKTTLKTGNVITIEPGLYYRGLGGARIEDTVVVTAKGFDYLAPCKLGWRL
ncbi:MAG: Xaa-Pro aminopeptidase [Kiritimatiellia bacterium]|jgi:Xaa-Pro aminopeptidase